MPQFPGPEQANSIVRKALEGLIAEYRGKPTLFLEEQHLHNAFDRILRKRISEDGDICVVAQTKDGIPFPLVMNEYTTINHYSAKKHFQKILNKQRGTSPGSLDYVWLSGQWVSDHTFCQAVNKDVGQRRQIWKRTSDGQRYLVVLEFKFDHYAKPMGNDRKKGRDFSQETVNSTRGKMQRGLEADFNKVMHEEAPYSHVVYFNSRVPLAKKEVKGVLEEAHFKKSNNAVTLWYAQGGVPWRFQPEDLWHEVHVYPAARRRGK